MRDLRNSSAYGYAYVEPLVPGPASADRSCGAIHKDIDATYAPSAFSKAMAETLPDLHRFYGQWRPLLTSLLYNAPLPQSTNLRTGCPAHRGATSSRPT